MIFQGYINFGFGDDRPSVSGDVEEVNQDESTVKYYFHTSL